MISLIADCETNGFLPELDRIHCLVTRDVETNTVGSFAPDQIEQGLALLETADEIIGHNFMSFDLRALQKVYPRFKPKAKIIDTLVLSRVIHPDLRIDGYRGKTDFAMWRHGQLPSKLIGRHSLEAWGYRLGDFKGDSPTDWTTWTPEMQTYCEQDVGVTAKMYRYFLRCNLDPRAWELEHEVQRICIAQEKHGIAFDEAGAQKLYAMLADLRQKLLVDLKQKMGTWHEPGEIIIPKVNNKTRGYVKGEPFQKPPIPHTFNPASREHIAKRLTALYGWKPTEFTDSGKPKIDDEILNSLPYPEAKDLAGYFVLAKRVAQIAEGQKAWLKHVRDGRIHGGIITNGAVTGRATHSNPNLAQVPSCDSPYGKECRSLFGAGTGNSLVGVDVSGLELRMLGHFMARYDGGAYGKEVCEGDIHTVNMKAAGLETRANAKTFIYGFLYGAGDEKIGRIVGKGKKRGGELKKQFLKGVPALAKLQKELGRSVDATGHIKGLDGRKIPVRHSHAALNTLLQSAGGLVCKRWLVEMDQAIAADATLHDKVQQALWVHDEVQLEVVAGYEEQLGKLAVVCIARAGDYFRIRVPLTGEFKHGRSWADTH